MTNEELAELIKKGRTEYYGELWEQTKRFFTMRAKSFYNTYRKKCNSSGVELDDLIQCCFFALTKTVESFELHKGYKLLSYADFHIRNLLKEACGMRTRRNEPLNNYISTDEPISNDGDGTLLDAFVDEYAFKMYEDIDKELTIRRLRKELDRMLEDLKPQQSQILRMHYYMGLTLAQIAEVKGVERSKIISIEEQALNSMYKPANRKILHDFKNVLIGSKRSVPFSYYRKGSFHTFYDKGGSSVELTFEDFCRQLKE